LSIMMMLISIPAIAVVAHDALLAPRRLTTFPVRRRDRETTKRTRSIEHGHSWRDARWSAKRLTRRLGRGIRCAITLGFGWRTAEEQAADEHRDRGARR
jgi:hypothetical protein